MTTKLELVKKPLGEVVKEVLEGMGKTVNLTVNQETRIALTVEPSLTVAEKQQLANAVPAWFRKMYNVHLEELEEVP